MPHWRTVLKFFVTVVSVIIVLAVAMAIYVASNILLSRATPSSSLWLALGAAVLLYLVMYLTGGAEFEQCEDAIRPWCMRVPLLGGFVPAAAKREISPDMGR
jgi:hypothetical protein